MTGTRPIYRIVQQTFRRLCDGAGIGAGAGSAVAFLKKGKDVQIRTDERFEIRLKGEVTLPANDY